MMKHLILQKNAKYDGYQCGLASMVYKFFDKITLAGAIKYEIRPNKELVEELHKPIIRKFETKKSILIFYRQYLGHNSCRHAIDN